MTLQEAIEASGYKTRSYSGRGMFGKACLGVQVASIGDLWVLGTKVGALMSVSCIHYPSVDAMGMEIIAYWPKVPYTEVHSVRSTEAPATSQRALHGSTTQAERGTE